MSLADDLRDFVRVYNRATGRPVRRIVLGDDLFDELVREGRDSIPVTESTDHQKPRDRVTLDGLAVERGDWLIKPNGVWIEGGGSKYQLAAAPNLTEDRTIRSDSEVEKPPAVPGVPDWCQLLRAVEDERRSNRYPQHAILGVSVFRSVVKTARYDQVWSNGLFDKSNEGRGKVCGFPVVLDINLPDDACVLSEDHI